MEKPPTYYSADEYFETSTGLRIGKKTILRGPDNVTLGERTIVHQSTIIRADLAKIITGKFCLIEEGCILKPTFLASIDSTKFLPIVMGDFVHLGKMTIMLGSKIGNNVKIGSKCVISQKVIIGDCVRILDDTYIPPDTLIPPFSVYGGRPAKFIAELPENTPSIHQDYLSENYYKFVKKN